MKSKYLIILLFIPLFGNAQESLPGAETCFIKLLNEYRVSKGLDSVKYSQTLYDWSLNQSLYLTLLNKQELSKDIITYISHGQSMDVKNFKEDKERIPKFKHKSLSENVGFSLQPVEIDEEIAKHFLQMWIDSPGHNENLLRDSKLIGISIQKINIQMTINGHVFDSILLVSAMNIGNL